MIEKSTIKFLKELKKNNTKEWFDANRKTYEAAKENVCNNISDLITAIGKFDPDIASLMLKECTFRINRDIRFAKDKTPYKNNISGYFVKGGKKSNAAGYYLHIEPGAAFLAAGLWWPEPKHLANVRQEIDYNFEEFVKIISTKKFKQAFPVGVAKKDTLQRAPKGYEETNPAIEYLKLKSIVVYKYLPDDELMEKDFTKKVAAAFAAAKPFLDFLNRAEDF